MVWHEDTGLIGHLAKVHPLMMEYHNEDNLREDRAISTKVVIFVACCDKGQASAITNVKLIFLV